jgi:hypothetical protein
MKASCTRIRLCFCITRDEYCNAYEGVLAGTQDDGNDRISLTTKPAIVPVLLLPEPPSDGAIHSNRVLQSNTASRIWRET